MSQLDHYKNIEVHIYEAARKLEEIGAGLTILGRTWELLGILGCQELVKKQAVTFSHLGSDTISNDAVFQFRKSDHNEGVGFLNMTLPGPKGVLPQILRYFANQLTQVELGQSTGLTYTTR